MAEHALVLGSSDQLSDKLIPYPKDSRDPSNRPRYQLTPNLPDTYQTHQTTIPTKEWISHKDPRGNQKNSKTLL